MIAFKRGPVWLPSGQGAPDDTAEKAAAEGARPAIRRVRDLRRGGSGIAGDPPAFPADSSSVESKKATRRCKRSRLRFELESLQRGVRLRHRRSKTPESRRRVAGLPQAV